MAGAMNKTEYVIGVTGHRDIHPDALDTVRAHIQQSLNEIQELLPNSAIRLVSGMADGADRIVVEEALSRNIKVDAVLPMPLEMYVDDFSETSAKELKKLLEHQNVTSEVIPLPDDEEASTFIGNRRDQLYLGLARVLSRRCSLLIAIWDGIDTGLPGGTSDTLLNFMKVPRRSSGEPVEFQTTAGLTHHGHSNGFAIWIPTKRIGTVDVPRTDRAYLTGISGRVVIDDTLPGELSNRISGYDAYNATFDERVKAGDLPSPYGLLDAVPKNVNPIDLRTLERIESEYTKADVMAVYYQKYSDRLFAGFAVAAGLMGFLFLVYAKILASNFFLLGYLGIFVGGFFAFRYVHNKHWFSKHLMYRLIAETMRTRFYLSLAGLGEGKHIRSFEKMTGINQFSGFDWITDVFKFVEPTAPQLISMDDQAGKERLAKIQEAWIDDQCAYFSKKNRQLTERHHLIENVKKILIGFLLIGTALLIFIKPLLVSTVLVGDLHLKTLIVFFMGFLPLCFGVWEIYSAKMAVKELAWQYRQQLDLFDDIRERLKVEPDGMVCQDIIGQLALDSLRESFLWTMQRFHREHEPPTAG